MLLELWREIIIWWMCFSQVLTVARVGGDKMTAPVWYKLSNVSISLLCQDQVGLSRKDLIKESSVIRVKGGSGINGTGKLFLKTSSVLVQKENHQNKIQIRFKFKFCLFYQLLLYPTPHSIKYLLSDFISNHEYFKQKQYWHNRWFDLIFCKKLRNFYAIFWSV